MCSRLLSVKEELQIGRNRCVVPVCYLLRRNNIYYKYREIVVQFDSLSRYGGAASVSNTDKLLCSSSLLPVKEEQHLLQIRRNRCEVRVSQQL